MASRFLCMFTNAHFFVKVRFLTGSINFLNLKHVQFRQDKGSFPFTFQCYRLPRRKSRLQSKTQTIIGSTVSRKLCLQSKPFREFVSFFCAGVGGAELALSGSIVLFELLRVIVSKNQRNRGRGQKIDLAYTLSV